MELKELKDRLGITDSNQDAMLQVHLDDAIEEAQEYCNQSFLDESGDLKLPSTVKKGIALLIDINRSSKKNVKSESIGGMSRTFGEDSRLSQVTSLWNRHRKIRFRSFR